MNETYKKLVDLYAGNELPSELIDEIETVAQRDHDLKVEMDSLRDTVEAIQEAQISYTEETHQRILMKIYARGGHLQPQAPEPAHLQYQLPMSG
ncbi:MAG: hypothetical protein ACK53G_07565 [Armatimonadota bacterium]|jgi:hypothetical protein|nr:hypothetical protein [Fimbriimonadaceae bacterium]MCE2767250.1 hypothetical protein [Fimbriimonadaceae bacterium]MCX6341175.1 hypothetical protein [Fimbriimonadales bacterium]